MYSPFGMVMPGRKYSGSPGYRYGFNGKENDNEVKGEGNQQDYGLRIYDTRLGRFLSVDPLTKNYPWYTPYQFAGNMPIRFIDLDGGEPKDPWDDFWAGQGDPIKNLGWMFQDAWNGNGKTHQVLDNFNKEINPVGIVIHDAYSMVTAKDLTYGTKRSRGDAFTHLGVNAVMYLSGEKFASGFKIPSLEAQMTANNKALVPSTAPKSQQPLLSLTNEEKQQIVSWVKENQMNSPLPPIRAVNTTPQIGPRVGKSFGELGYTISEGRIKLNNRAVTNGTFDFIITSDGQLKIGTGHYSLAGNDPRVTLKAAGQINIYKGKITDISNSSGHYQPTVEQAREFGNALKEVGVDVSGAKMNIYSESGNKVEKIKL